MCYKLTPLKHSRLFSYGKLQSFSLWLRQSIPPPERRSGVEGRLRSFSHISSQSKFQSHLTPKNEGVNKITFTESHKMQRPQLWSQLNVLLHTTEKQVVKRFLSGYHESSHLIFYFLTISKSDRLKSIECKGKREQHSKHTLEQQDPNFLVLKECDSLMSHLSPQQRARLCPVSGGTEGGEAPAPHCGSPAPACLPALGRWWPATPARSPRAA